MASMRVMASAAFAALVLSLGAEIAYAQTAKDAFDLTVDVSGIRNYKGQIIFYLWRDTDDAAKFPDPSKVQFRDEGKDGEPCDFAKAAICRRTVGNLQDLKVSYTFRGLPPGSYAVFAVHDENNNGVLDRGMLHRPLEARGYSMVLPDDVNPIAEKIKFQTASFSLTDSKTITVGLRYPPRL